MKKKNDMNFTVSSQLFRFYEDGYGRSNKKKSNILFPVINILYFKFLFIQFYI